MGEQRKTGKRKLGSGAPTGGAAGDPSRKEYTTMGVRGKRGETFKFTEAFVLERLNGCFLRDPQYAWDHIRLFHWESDHVVKTRAGVWHEVEVKVSMADFRRDFAEKTEKHCILSGEIMKPLKPNRFWFAVPETMMLDVLAELPEYAGLVSVPRFGEYVSVVRQAPLLTGDKFTDADLDLTGKFYWLARSYKSRYEGFSDEKARLKAELDLVKAEFEAATGQSWREYLSDCQ